MVIQVAFPEPPADNRITALPDGEAHKRVSTDLVGRMLEPERAG